MLGLRPNPSPAGTPDAAKGGLIKDGTDASFMADVVEESRKQPVIVDFWATWCGPCRQLTPALEKAVKAANGAVKLVKIDVDKNPAYAGQLRVQSIPTVYAFKDGQPVDGFMGALPESQVKAFIDKLGGGPAGPSEVEQLLELATESLGLGDVGGAAQAYAQVLQLDPQNVKAIAGLGRAYLSGGDAERAAEILAMAPADSKDPELASLRAASSSRRRRPTTSRRCSRRCRPTRRPRRPLRAGQRPRRAGAHGRAVDHLLHIVKPTAPGRTTARASSC
jgi:putative thioredoxin